MKTIPIIYSEKHKEHNPPFELYDGVLESYAEKADRLESIVSEFKKQGITSIIKPKQFPLHHITSVHKEVYREFLEERSGKLTGDEILYPSYFIMDTYTPIAARTYSAARVAVDVAVTGAEMIQSGEDIVYALCRPPGHHAETTASGGYCYFNNAAIAANYLSQRGTVAILDIDFHHGNGIQNIFYDRADVFYLSIHADPTQKFPYVSGFADEKGRGEGVGYTKNFPLATNINDIAYQKILDEALVEVREYNPAYLIISCGFDTYKHDPIGGFQLTIPYYKKISQSIRSLQLPTLIVQEGGYHIADLGKIAYSFLQGLSV